MPGRIDPVRTVYGVEPVNFGMAMVAASRASIVSNKTQEATCRNHHPTPVAFDAARRFPPLKISDPP